MDLIVHQVMQLHHVHVPDGHRAPERLARPSVVDRGLTTRRQFRFLQQIFDLFFRRAVKHGAGDMDPECLGRPSEMRFENLAHIHPRRNPQRVQHDLDRRPVGQVRHVFLRENPRDHAFVPVPTGHLVADRHLPLHRDVHLHQLDHAGRQFIAPLQSSDSFVVPRLEDLDLLLGVPLDLLERLLLVRIAENDMPDVPVRQLLEDLGRELPLLLEDDIAALRVHEVSPHDLSQ